MPNEGTIEDIVSLSDDNEIENEQAREQLRATSQRTVQDLRSYGLLGEGESYALDVTQDQGQDFDPVATIQNDHLPFMISVVPPKEFPTGEFRTQRIRAPQQISTTPTSVGKNVIAKRDRTGGSNPAGFRGASRDATVEDLVPIKTNEEGEVVARDDTAEVNEDGDIVQSTARDGAVLDAEIETEVPVESTEAADEREQSFNTYLKNLKSRYQTFKNRAERSDKSLEQDATPQVEGRRLTEDTFAEHKEDLEKNRALETSESYIRDQAELMLDLPPLFMYINPSEFSVSYEHVVSETKTREHHVIEHWGLEQPEISGSGEIGAFYIDDNEGGGGLTQTHRAHSAAYRSFMNLFMIYRNNGYLYGPDEQISLVGSVRMFYDGTIYIGSFDDFSVSESEEKPFSIEYDFSFTVRYQKDIDV